MANINLSGSISTTGTAILGSFSVIFTSNANHTLSVTEYTNKFLNVTSSVSLTTTRELIAPAAEGQEFVIQNNTTGGQAITIIASGTGVTIADGYTASVVCDGTNYIQVGGISTTSGSFTAGGDLSGTATDQVVIGLQTIPLASTTPVQSAVPVYDTATLQYDVRKLTLDDVGPAFAITGFSGGSTVEIGATVTNPAFTASYSSTPASAQITNTDSIDSPLILITPFTSGTVVGSFHHTSQTSVVFTLSATAATTKTTTSNINFDPRMFGGVGTAGATSSVTASGNTAVLSTSDVLASEGLTTSPVGATYGPFSPSSQVIYLLLIGGSHTFKDANTGFAFPFNSPTSVSFTNQNSAVVSMFLYQSTNVLSATYSIEVVS